MSWITPLGLPVIQPYRKSTNYQVVTLLQKLTLTSNSDSLPVSVQKQKSAFPPNFVHSLDATHMLMTSLRMKKRGLIFSSVHDSYWTYASDVSILNKVVLLLKIFLVPFYLTWYNWIGTERKFCRVVQSTCVGTIFRIFKETLSEYLIPSLAWKRAAWY